MFDSVNRLGKDGTALIPVRPSKDKSQKPCITVKSKIIQLWASFAAYAAIMQDVDMMAKTNWSNRPKTVRATIQLGGMTKEDMRYAIANASVDSAELGIRAEYKGMQCEASKKVLIVPFVAGTMPSKYAKKMMQESIEEAFMALQKGKREESGARVTFESAPMILIKCEFPQFHYVAQYINGERVQ